VYLQKGITGHSSSPVTRRWKWQSESNRDALRGAPWGAPLSRIAELLSGRDGFLPPGTGQDRNAGREEDEDTGRWDGGGG
jgi:hypothetical protein